LEFSEHFVAEKLLPLRSMTRRAGNAINSPIAVIKWVLMNAAPKQDVAIVAIGRNEGERLKRCLRSVVGKARTVVYVDSGSADGSAEFAASLGCDVVELTSAQGCTAARARNEGFARVMKIAPEVAFVQFVDGDCELADGWLKQGAIALARSTDVGVVCGHVREISPEATIYNRLCDLEGRQPPGEVRSARGAFMVRSEVFSAAAGFRDELIAAEDEEFCVRVRSLGERVLKLDREMARRDAAMTRFSQWWETSRRSGYGYAQGAALHGSGQDHSFVRSCRGMWVWGLALPLLGLGLAPFTRGVSLAVMLLAYVLQLARIYALERGRGWPADDAAIYAFFTVIFRFPALQGLLGYSWRQMRGRGVSTIENKRQIEDKRQEEFDTDMPETAEVPSDAEAGTLFAQEEDHRGGRLRVALVGAGSVAEWHAKALRSVKNVQLVAVCDRIPGRAEAFAVKFGVPQAYRSLDAMLAAEKLDAVHILVPSDLHFEAAQTALLAGVNVLLEQPMGESAESCDALVEMAVDRGLRLAVAHNYLFAEPYERLRNDVCAGALGRIADVTITWHRPLAQLMQGPFDSWMLRNPRNVLIEIGAHSVAHLLDLVGEPEEMQVQPDSPIELPAGGRFYRRWQVTARKGPTAVELRFSFVPGFSEYTIHVRGSLAAATVDLERNTYTLHRHHPTEPDFDAYVMLASEAASLRRQARRSLWASVLSRLHRRERGNPYGDSIAKAIDAFYATPDQPLDARVNGRLGAQAVLLSALMGKVAIFPADEFDHAAAGDALPVTRRSHKKSRILVLGGTGFLGSELVRQLGESGQKARLLVRDASAVPRAVHESAMEVLTGDLMNQDDLRRAMEGVDSVFHLARAHVNSWLEYQKFEIEATRQVAECALEAGVKRLIYTGTIDSYYAGRRAGKINARTPLDPHIERRNLNARAKAASEKILMRMHRVQGLPVVILRPGIVVGRGASPFHAGIGMWWYDSVCQIWGKGTNKLPLVLVDDVARALLAALETPGIEGQSFNLVGEPCLSAQEYLDELDRCGGMRIERHATPIWRFYLADWMKWAIKVAIQAPERRLPSYRDWESRTRLATFDCTAAKAALGWVPESSRTELVRRGIEEPLMDWMR
jgi:predicted dehydrogenase/nucleoside-diphosphate-sugar epimerase/glycosyltransferase involved in cell wall biosynthesis